jgi:hypothetical protein
MKEKDIKADCIVMLTDGYFYSGEGDWSDVTAPLLWVVKGNRDFKPKHGIAVHIN